MASSLPEWVFQAEALIHQIVDDTHLMFQIAASSDVKKESLQKRHTVYSTHMQELHQLICNINNEMVIKNNLCA